MFNASWLTLPDGIWMLLSAAGFGKIRALHRAIRLHAASAAPIIHRVVFTAASLFERITVPKRQHQNPALGWVPILIGGYLN